MKLQWLCVEGGTICIYTVCLTVLYPAEGQPRVRVSICTKRRSAAVTTYCCDQLPSVLRNRLWAHVPGAVKEVIQLLETQSGRACLAVRTDNGKEYVNAELSAFFASKGIVHQKAVPYTPEQNGGAERQNRTIMDRVRAMLADADLPAGLWAEAAETANYIRCRSPATNKLKTPWELFHGRKPDVSAMRAFGSVAYAQCPRRSGISWTLGPSAASWSATAMASRPTAS